MGMVPSRKSGSGGPSRRLDRWRGAGLLLLVASISALHYTTSPTHVVWHEVFQRLYYVPIVLGAYWFGVSGGVLVAMAASVAYVPHIRTAWGAGVQQQASRYAELVVFNVVGLIVGLLASAQHRVSRRYRQAAASLEAANRELRESYEHLRRADRLSALGEVAAGLAHEIRHPLASIGGSLEIIESRAPADSPEAEFSRLGRKELERLDRLVTDFLLYARPREPELRDTPVGDVVDRVMALAQVEADRASVTLHADRPAIEPTASIDPQQIEQVLLNVVLNAIQASPQGGRVTVQESVESPDVLIDVTDEGPGVPEEQLPRIFSPFFTTKEKGTGLGLAIVHRIVATHGGSIDAMPCEAGRGGWFRIRLPMARPASQSPAAFVPEAH
jgi:two-component system, NtrC family, sensor histidine kinase HydH